MTTKLWLSFLTLTSVVATTQTAQSQTYTPTNRSLVGDSTLGTQVSATGNNFDITGGLRQGQTLFHSFTDFSVPENRAANFLNPVGNRDIITRVTGGLFSDINGIVNTNGANFFLINPSGIVFGPSATLNVGKAFVGSTANSIDLVGGGQTIKFGANPNGDALLSVAPNVLFDVSRLNLGGGNGAISNFGTLQVPNLNQYIGLIGGNVNVNGGRIIVPGGRVDLGGLAAAGGVTFGAQGQAQLPTNVARADVSLTNGATVNVGGAGGGDVAINARNLEILGGSVVASGIGTGFGTPATVAGNVKITASGSVLFDGNKDGFVGGAASTVEQGAVGKGGGVEINARNLTVTNGARLTASTRGQGDAGNVKVTASGNVLFDGNKDDFGSGAASTVEQGAVGNGGGVEINARNLTVTNGARLTASTRGQGNAGSVKVTATGAVSLVGVDTGILSAIESGGVGNGGNIEFRAGSLSLRDGAQVTSGTYSSGISSPGRGNAGDIKVLVKENIDIAGEGRSSLGFERQSGIFAANFGEGKAGNLDIISIGNISLIQRGEISVNAFGQLGSAGNILLASNKLTLNQGAILAVGENGQDGSINIKNTDLLLMRNSSLISTSSGRILGGRGGNIAISAPFIIALPGNNDIQANAYAGGGALLSINSQGLFGIQYKPQGQASPFSNDITTSNNSQQDELLFNDPVNVIQVPIATIDASNQISQVCNTSNRENKLTVTGRGGLPPNANDPLTSDVVWQDARGASPQPVASSAITNPAKLIPPAVGWVFDGKGKVTLVAANTPGQPTRTSVICPTK